MSAPPEPSSLNYELNPFEQSFASNARETSKIENRTSNSGTSANPDVASANNAHSAPNTTVNNGNSASPGIPKDMGLRLDKLVSPHPIGDPQFGMYGLPSPAPYIYNRIGQLTPQGLAPFGAPSQIGQLGQMNPIQMVNMNQVQPGQLAQQVQSPMPQINPNRPFMVNAPYVDNYRYASTVATNYKPENPAPLVENAASGLFMLSRDQKKAQQIQNQSQQILTTSKAPNVIEKSQSADSISINAAASGQHQSQIPTLPKSSRTPDSVSKSLQTQPPEVKPASSLTHKKLEPIGSLRTLGSLETSSAIGNERAPAMHVSQVSIGSQTSQESQPTQDSQPSRDAQSHQNAQTSKTSQDPHSLKASNGTHVSHGLLGVQGSQIPQMPYHQDNHISPVVAAQSAQGPLAPVLPNPQLPPGSQISGGQDPSAPQVSINISSSVSQPSSSALESVNDQDSRKRKSKLPPKRKRNSNEGTQNIDIPVKLEDVNNNDNVDNTSDIGEQKTPKTEEEKRKLFLERNRVAALKSRRRKKQWVNDLQNKIDLYTKLTDDLQMENDKLLRKQEDLKRFILQIYDARLLPSYVLDILDIHNIDNQDTRPDQIHPQQQPQTQPQTQPQPQPQPQPMPPHQMQQAIQMQSHSQQQSQQQSQPQQPQYPTPYNYRDFQSLADVNRVGLSNLPSRTPHLKQEANDSSDAQNSTVEILDAHIEPNQYP